MSARDTGTEQSFRDSAKQISFAREKFHAAIQDITDSAGIDNLWLIILLILNSTYPTTKL